ncbi:MAG: YdcF family protein [Bacteroidota bacterium]
MDLSENKIWSGVRKIFKTIFFILGVFSFILVVFSFTRIPYDVQIWLGSYQCTYKFYPDEIVFLGGSGMPSESNLIRLYYVSELSKKYPQSKILIVHPIDESVISDMRDELILRGIDSTKIEIEKEGTNTHDQATNVSLHFPRLLRRHVLIVTSTESMLRTVSAFRKAGFESVGGQSAYEVPMFIDLGYNFKKSGGKIYSPDVSGNIALRYNFWNYLKLEISCLREFTAIGYYWINGWI